MTATEPDPADTDTDPDTAELEPAPAPAPAPEETPPAPSAPSAPPGRAEGWMAKVLGGATALLTTAGAAGGAVVGYQLATDLGKGDPRPGDQAWAIASLGAFAVGAALLLTIPLALQRVTRATLTSAVHREQQNASGWRKRWHRLRPKQSVVGPEILEGYDTVEDFRDAMVAALADHRASWNQGLERPIGIEARLAHFIAQREQAELHVAADQVARTARTTAWQAVLGLVMVVVGYGNASFLTAQGIRSAQLADAETTAAADAAKVEASAAVEAATADAAARAAIDLLVLQAELDRTKPGGVLPRVPSEVVVAFPDEAAAADVFGSTAAALPDECWQDGRAGRAYDLVDPAAATPTRIVRVLLDATSTACRATVVTVPPGWVSPTGTEVSAAVTTTVPPAGTPPADGE